MRYQRAELPLKLDGLEAARAFFAGCIADSDVSREKLWVAHVDDEARCLHVSCHEGDQWGAAFPLRTIIADAAVHGSAGIVLAHNHPSGDPRPRRSRPAPDAVHGQSIRGGIRCGVGIGVVPCAGLLCLLPP